MPARERILVAMSGGVDSSVAALVLKSQGHEIVGAYMKNWINEDNVIGHCPWLQDIEDARAVADRIGIEFRVVNLMQDYRRLVVDYLLDGYQRGLTPNPDVMCNREMKFGVFLRYAQTEGFAAVATGHYAQRIEVERVVPNALGKVRPPGGPARRSLGDDGPLGDRPLPNETEFGLFEGTDKNKDQSYFLALLSQAQVRAARFPIGHLPKPELRRLARAAGLPNADKKDSQGICFIGEVKMADFLKTYVPDHPGPIVRATDGRVLGEHRGLHYYTIGQRKGIGIPSNTDHEAYVVVGKRAGDHALLVAFDSPTAPGLWTDTCRVHSPSFIGEPITENCQIECRVRYRDPRVAIEFVPDGWARPLGAPSNATEGGPGSPALPQTASIKFEQPQRALAPGQIMALYRGEQLLGGGVFV